MYSPYNIPLKVQKNYPREIPAFIEVSQGSRNKYEYNKATGFLMLDRVLHSAVFYPYDYGFIPQTLCDDGDPLDVLVMGTSPLVPGCVALIRPICYMVMEDEKGQDEKVLAVLAKDPNYSHVHCMADLPPHKLKEVTQFFETYKALEKDKWVRVGEWKDVDATHTLIEETHVQYNTKVSGEFA
jgi:inorganic pyrophosphatase